MGGDYPRSQTDLVIPCLGKHLNFEGAGRMLHVCLCDCVDCVFHLQFQWNRNHVHSRLQPPRVFFHPTEEEIQP